MKKTKKLTKAAAVQQHKSHRFILLGCILLIVALVIILAATYALPTIANKQRLNRIATIYSSLELSDTFILQNEQVFGDKRVYDYDKSRTFSSAKYYVYPAKVDETMKILDAAATKAGFVKFDEPYPGAVDLQYHYKSAKNEYLRISVSSKLRNDAFQNSFLMTGEYKDEDYRIDPNAGPSEVTVKVNLDDNNE